MSKKQKEEKDIRHYYAVVAICVSLLLTFTVYTVCGERLFGAVKDLGLSIAYYFLFIFRAENMITPTVTELPNVDITKYLPFDLDELVRKLEVFPKVFWSSDNFGNYITALAKGLNIIVILSSLILPAVIMIFYLIYNSYTEKHVKIKKTSKAEKLYGKLCRIYTRLKSFVMWLAEYYKKHKIYKNLFIFVWLVNTNIMTIILEAFAYYFFLVVSFNFLSIGTQIAKLVIDFVIMLWTLPHLLWSVIGYIVFDIVRKSAAYKKLKHMEAKNRGFDNELPIVTMAVGSMGVGKTKTTVDIALSQENNLKDMALGLMDKNMLRFPEFDFQSFELDLSELIKAHKIKNLATARKYIRQKRFDYGRHPAPSDLWGYDVGKHARSYNNGLELVGIWRTLENYAQEYFIYTMTVSSIVSNIAIRSDIDVIDEGFFKLFNNDFFKRDPAKVKDYSAYAHIIDFDLFRVGCQMNKEKAVAGSFEFGVIFVSEIGKERKNALELKKVKTVEGEANQTIDLFNEWLKMIRHAATVEGCCFVRFLCDEQRPESWGADARDLCAILHILSVSELKLSIRFCFLPRFFMSVVQPKYSKWYHKVKKHGNENVFSVRILHITLGHVFRACERKLNGFGYYTEIVGIEWGTMTDEELREHKYYLIPKKIYAGRYSTDCYKNTFAQRALEAGTSLYTLPSYESSCATLEELGKQNSYMANTFIAMYVPATIQYAMTKRGVRK